MWTLDRTYDTSAGHVRAGAAGDGPEQGTPPVTRQRTTLHIVVQPGIEIVVTGHVVTLAPLLVQPHPEAPVLDIDILHPHGQGRTDPGEAVDHQPDQGAVAQPDRG